MKTRIRTRRLLALALALALCLSLLPVSAGAAEGYTQITSLAELTTGQYLLVNSGYAATKLDGSWVLSTPVDTATFSDVTTDMVWTLTVDGTNVTLADSTGVTIAPAGGNTNGIKSGAYNWSAAFADGAFTFSGQGADTVTLACNKSQNYKIRAYKNTTVAGSSGGYPSKFSLYRVTGDTPTPPDPEEDITKLTPSAAYEGSLTAGTTVTLSCPGISGEAYEVSVDGGAWTAISGNAYVIPENAKSVAFRAEKNGAYSQTLTLTVEQTLPEGVSTIAEARAAQKGAEVTVIGTVVYASGKNVYVQDATGGICLYFSAAPADIAKGDSLRATGTRDTYNGLEELTGVTCEKVGTDELPLKTVTVKELKNDTAQSLECTRVELKGLTLGTVNTSGNTPLTDGEGNSINAYRAAALADFAAGDKVNLIAVVSDYNGYQLLVESASPAGTTAPEGGYAVDADVVEAFAQWGGGGPYDDSNNTQIYADRFKVGDMLDKTGVFTAVVNGKEVKPYQANKTSTGGYTYYMGGFGVGGGSNDYMQLSLSTAGWGNLSMTFRLRSSNSAPGDWQLAYSTDGGDTFTNFTQGTYRYAYTAYGSNGSYEVSGEGEITDGIAKTSLAPANYITFTFDVPAVCENCSQLLIRLLPGTTRANGAAGAPSASGATRFDSVKVIGSPVVDDKVAGYVSVDPNGRDEDQAPGTALTMTSATENAVIHYTFLDQEGNALGAEQIYDPANKPVLPAALPVYLEVYASRTGLQNSAKALFHYAAGTVASVRFTPNGGGVYLGNGAVKVELTCDTADAVIWFAVEDEAYQVYDPNADQIVLTDGFGSKTVRAYATKEGFNDSPVTTRTFTQRSQESYNIYFGQMHSHTSYSDGAGTANDAFAHATEVKNLDFLAVTDHSNSFDNGDKAVLYEDASLLSSEWKEGKELAQRYTTDTFVGLFGYEMTWSNGLGHINTFNTPGFQSRTQTDYTSYATALQNYYARLKTVSDSISQFNHPGTTFGDFSDFAHYDTELDQLICLVEVGNGEGAIGSSGYFPSYEYFTRALDKGWHVAPTNNQDNHKGLWGDANTARSVVLADSLTERDIYDAMRNYRVYATEDNDLSIYYTLDGNIMGTILTKEDVGDTLNLSVRLSDPTDASIGRVEVIVNGGLSIANQTVNTAAETVSFSVCADYSYYYIKVTQPDGDIAVTAPVWVGEVEAVGVSDFSTTAPMAVQNQPLDLNVTLFNNEKTKLNVTKVEFSVLDSDDETTVIKTLEGEELTAAGLSVVEKLSTASYSFNYTYSGLGNAEYTVTVYGTLNGVGKIYSGKLTLSYVSEEMVTRVVVDGTHYNDYVTGYYGGNMSHFVAMGAEESVAVTIAGGDKAAADRSLTQAQWQELLSNCSLLVVSAPARNSGSANAGEYHASGFEDWWLALVSDYVKAGGSVVVCGLADYQDKNAADAGHHIAAQMNQLLTAIGSTLRINDDEAYDEVNNGGLAYRLYPNNFNMESKWLTGVVAEQTYSQFSGSTVNPGSGEALVMGFDTTYSIDSDKDGIGGVEKGTACFLAAEDTSYGGTVFAAGGVFLSDFEVDFEKDNAFDLPYANTNIAKNILDSVKVELPITPIGEVRRVANSGASGNVYRVRGYVTAGTANENNSFFDCIYVQDETGGMDIFPYAEAGLELGTEIEIIGYLDSYQGDLELKVMSYKIVNDEELHPWAPAELTCKEASDYAANGGLLIQVSGTVKPGSLYYNADGTLAQFVVVDSTGETTIFIDGYILSGTTGTNTLAQTVKEGAAVTAVGVQYMHPESFVPGVTENVSVLRVRDCDEIKVSATHTHSFGAWTQTKAPTCTEAGEESRSCGGCGEKETRPVAALGHNWDDGVVTTPATPTAEGVMTFTCRRCGVTRTEAIPATGKCDGGDSCPSHAFTDVPGPDDWAHAGIDFAVSNGLLNGVGNNKIAPEESMTRAMLVTVLWRYIGKPTGYENNFTDIEDGLWYTDAVAWAAAEGVVNGVGGGKFAPDDLITREQMAAILFRYAKANDVDVSARKDFSDFPDADEVGSWAMDAMQWAVAQGLITGSKTGGKTYLLPGDGATRGQVATILMRYIQNVIQ